MAEEKNLPKLVSDAMESSISSDEKAAIAQQNLANQMKVFADSNKAFAKTSVTLNKFAAAQIDKINPFKKLGAAFDKSWLGQKRIQIKEEEKLAEAAGITRDELLLIKAQKDVADSQKEQAAALERTLKEYGVETKEFADTAKKVISNEETLDDSISTDAKFIVQNLATNSRLKKLADEEAKRENLESQNLLISDVRKGLDGVKQGILSNGQTIGESFEDARAERERSETAAIEGQRETARRDEERMALHREMVGGIKGLGKSLLDGLKGLGQAGGAGIGMLFGIIAAPVIALAGFFKSLKAEFAFLNRLTNGKLAAPFVKAIEFIKGLGSKLGKVLSAKNIPVDKILKPFQAIGDFFKGIGSKISSLFGKSGTFGKVFGVISKGFAPIAKFASGFGSVLGKLFLPITVIMGIVDTVTGFMDGFETDGLLGGVMGAIKGLFNGLIMKPLDLLKDGVSWIASKLGFENFSEMLDSFSFEGMFSGMVDGLTNILKGVGEWFSDKVDWVKGLLGMETSKEQAERESQEKEMAEVRKERSKIRIEKEASDAVIDSRMSEIAQKYGSLQDAPQQEKDEIAELKKERLALRNRLERIEGVPTEAGGVTGSRVNTRSAQQKAAAVKCNHNQCANCSERANLYKYEQSDHSASFSRKVKAGWSKIRKSKLKKRETEVSPQAMDC